MLHNSKKWSFLKNKLASAAAELRASTWQDMIQEEGETTKLKETDENEGTCFVLTNHGVSRVHFSNLHAKDLVSIDLRLTRFLFYAIVPLTVVLIYAGLVVQKYFVFWWMLFFWSVANVQFFLRHSASKHAWSARFSKKKPALKYEKFFFCIFSELGINLKESWPFWKHWQSSRKVCFSFIFQTKGC